VSARARWRAPLRALGRIAALAGLCLVALQLAFLARVAMLVVIDPHSTSFQRSEAWRLLTGKGRLPWRQQWVDYDRISPHLKRAVVAAEDSGFADHSGVEWDAIERAWESNLRTEAQAAQPHPRGVAARAGARTPRLVGGSTITQQLAKNLFLSGERSVLRKGQEFLITLMLEALLDKPRLLEIYLNHVEWGEGVFGAQAAAQHYFRTDAAQLGPMASARLAVMLPAPKRFEKRPDSAYIAGRAAAVAAGMGSVEVP
jgi:monofunctional biosynthetic peptidoglycan transglycosylase